MPVTANTYAALSLDQVIGLFFMAGSLGSERPGRLSRPLTWRKTSPKPTRWCMLSSDPAQLLNWRPLGIPPRPRHACF